MTKEARTNLLSIRNKPARMKNMAKPGDAAQKLSRVPAERSPLIETYLVRRLADIKQVSEYHIKNHIPLDKQNIQQRHRLRLAHDIRRDFGIVLNTGNLKPDETISSLAGRLVSGLLAKRKNH